MQGLSERKIRMKFKFVAENEVSQKTVGQIHEGWIHQILLDILDNCSHVTCNSEIGRLLIAVSWQGMEKKKKKEKLLAVLLRSFLTDQYWPAGKQHVGLDKLSI